MSSSVRETATEAARCKPTDWAALGARILAAAGRATDLHVATVDHLKANGRWSERAAGAGRGKGDSAEPNL